MPDEPAERSPQTSPPTRSQSVARAAAAQHGLVRREQVLAAGYSTSTIARWLKDERLHPVHHNLYALGHGVLGDDARAHALVLACAMWEQTDGTLAGAARSHQSAAAALGLLREWNGDAHVAALRRLALAGCHVHRVRSLDPLDVTDVGGVPTTTWSRTLLDLAEVLQLRWLIRALEQSVIHELHDDRVLQETMARGVGRRGIPALRAALAAGHHLDPQVTRSVLEDEFLFLVRSATPALPELPQMNAPLELSYRHRFEVDALWRRLRVALELDSRFHDPPGARMRDRERDRALRAAGYRTFRVRWADVVQRPGWVLWKVRELLARAAQTHAA